MNYSFIVPIYNDGYLARDFCDSFEQSFVDFLGIKNIENITELIFVNDGSSDNSINQLIELSETKKFVKVIDLSRNFGQHIALSCGYKNASGEYVGMLNVDMQEPPSEIPKLLKFIKNNNFDIVYGLFDQRRTTFINRVTSRFFSNTLNFLTKSKVPLNVTTLRVMNRKFVNAYNELNEKSRYIPGLEIWLGFNHGYLPVIHTSRKSGKSSYNFKKRLNIALESVISFSDFPLKIIVTVGLFIAIIGFILSSFLIVTKLFFIDYKAGYTSTICFFTLLGGIQIMVVGMSSLYIGRILKEVQNRPLYIINNKYNF